MNPLHKGDASYLDGLLEAFDEFPDGAWQAACEEAIAEDIRFKGRDPYEVWIAWCYARRSDKRNYRSTRQ